MKRQAVIFGLLTLIFLVILLTWTATANAQAPTSDDVKRVSDKLNCPLCQGRNLTECPLPICDQMRQIIAQKLAAGESDEQIMQYFVAQYGEQVLNQPPLRGFNIVGWVVPFVGLAVGAVIVVFAFRQWSQRRQIPLTVQPSQRSIELPNEYLTRLEQELKEYK